MKLWYSILFCCVISSTWAIFPSDPTQVNCQQPAQDFDAEEPLMNHHPFAAAPVVGTIGAPFDPYFNGFSATQKAKVKHLHRAMYYYFLAALDAVDHDQAHYTKWFGRVTPVYVNKVKSNLRAMIKGVTQGYTYVFQHDPRRCQGPDPKTGRTICYYAYNPDQRMTATYVCPALFTLPDLIAPHYKRTKFCALIHEFSHALAHTNRDSKRFPEKYYANVAMNLAQTDPLHAVNNAENYCFFVSTLNIFDYGIDSMTIQGGRLYLTRGNVVLAYDDNTGTRVSAGYPKLIPTEWTSIPDHFQGGFDTMFNFGGHFYITKGNKYHYSCNTIPCKVNPILSKVALPPEFQNGFDAAVVLGPEKSNNKSHLYLTHGSHYIGIDDTGSAGPVLPLQGNWGSISSGSFNLGFDSMARLGDGKVYVTKGKNYVRYSDACASKVDLGYPKPIKGDWGTINF